MGPCVGHGIFHIIVRQIITGAARIPGIKGKLQHLHARKTAVFHQLAHGIGHIPQILRDHLSISQHFLHAVKQTDPRPLLPFSHNSRLGPVGNGIILVKSPKMINPHHIIQFKTFGNPLNPPAVPGLPMMLPAVERIPPELSGSRKAVRRTAGHCYRLSLFVKLKQLRMGPGIRTVISHIDRNISNDLDALSVGIFL